MGRKEAWWFALPHSQATQQLSNIFKERHLRRAWRHLHHMSHASAFSLFIHIHVGPLASSNCDRMSAATFMAKPAMSSSGAEPPTGPPGPPAGAPAAVRADPGRAPRSKPSPSRGAGACRRAPLAMRVRAEAPVIGSGLALGLWSPAASASCGSRRQDTPRAASAASSAGAGKSARGKNISTGSAHPAASVTTRSQPRVFGKPFAYV